DACAAFSVKCSLGGSFSMLVGSVNEKPCCRLTWGRYSFVPFLRTAHRSIVSGLGSGMSSPNMARRQPLHTYSSDFSFSSATYPIENPMEPRLLVIFFLKLTLRR